MIAGSIALFDPLTPGSFLCDLNCPVTLGSPLDFPAIIADINNIAPGDPLIQEYLTDMPNAVTPSEVAIDDLLNQSGTTFDFGNAATPASFGALGADLQALAPSFETFFESIGLYQPALGDAVTGTLDLSNFSTDLSTLLASIGASLAADMPSMF